MRRSKQIPLWVLILLVEGAVVLLLLAVSPLLVTRMELQPDAAKGRTPGEVKRREAHRLAAEKERRARQTIPEKDAEKLKKDLVKRHRESIRKDTSRLEDLAQDLSKKRAELETRAKSRAGDELFAKFQALLRRQILEMEAKAEVFHSNSADPRAVATVETAWKLSKSNEKLLENPKEIAAGMKADADSAATQVLAAIKEHDEIPDVQERQRRFGAAIDIHLVVRKIFEIQQTLVRILELDASSANNLGNLPAPAQAKQTPAAPDTIQGQLEAFAATTQALQGDLKAVRALELALLEGIPVDEALRKVAAPEVQFPFEALDGALAAPVQTVGDLDALRRGLSAVSAATSSNVRAVGNSLAQGRGKGQMDSSAIRSASIVAGLERGPGLVADISGFMNGGGGGTSFANGMIRQGVRGGGGGETGGDPSRNSAQGGAGTTATARTSKVSLDTALIAAQALPGRKFRKHSARKGWLYLDTWYVIGPWENGGTIDYEKIHPPEYEVDFSKSYADGKSKDRGGVPRELRWQFTQASSVKVIPPDESSDSTYYAYTEVHFDEAKDMLIAIASDDAAKVWINGFLVWEDRGLGAWALDEGFRNVHFRQGHNTILVRIENGPTLCNFSVLLCPPKARL